MKKFILVSATICALSSVSVAVEYSVINIGGLIPNHYRSWAQDINDHGDVVGYHVSRTNDYQAFVWSQSHGLRFLPALPLDTSTGASTINNNGVIFGGSSNLQAGHSVTWNQQLEVEMIEHPMLLQSAAIKGLNSSGVFTGNQGGNDSAGFVFGNGVEFKYFGSPAGTTNKMLASAINDQGQVAGQTVISNRIQASLYDPISGIRMLGAPGYSSSNAINNLSQVAGNAGSSISERRGFFWDPQQGFMSVGVLAGGSRSHASSLNNRGEVVGWSESTLGRIPFIWNRREGIRSLRSLVSYNPEAIRLHDPNAINDNGWIAGYGFLSSGLDTAVVVRPVPEPISVLTLGAGFLFMLRKKTA